MGNSLSTITEVLKDSGNDFWYIVIAFLVGAIALIVKLTISNSKVKVLENGIQIRNVGFIDFQDILDVGIQAQKNWNVLMIIKYERDGRELEEKILLSAVYTSDKALKGTISVTGLSKEKVKQIINKVGDSKVSDSLNKAINTNGVPLRSISKEDLKLGGKDYTIFLT